MGFRETERESESERYERSIEEVKPGPWSRLYFYLEISLFFFVADFFLFHFFPSAGLLPVLPEDFPKGS